MPPLAILNQQSRLGKTTAEVLAFDFPGRALGRVLEDDPLVLQLRPDRVGALEVARLARLYPLGDPCLDLGRSQRCFLQERTLALFIFAIPIALHIAANATSRFRVPWMPLLVCYAGYAWAHRRGLADRISRRGRVGLAVSLGFLLFAAVPYFFVYGGRQ